MRNGQTGRRAPSHGALALSSAAADAAPGPASRLFGIQAGEGRKVALFALLAALLQAGIAVGVSASDALFLTRVGVQRLPYVYLGILLILALYVPSVTHLLRRIGIERTLLLILGVLVSGGALLFLGLRLASGDWIYYAAKLYASAWYIGLYTLFWNFADSFFDIQDGKRLFAFFSGGSAAGALVGGALVAVLSRTWEVGTLFLVWSAFSLMAIPVAGLIARRYAMLAEAGEEDVAGQGMRDQLRLAAGSMHRSRYVLALALALLAVFFLGSLVEYQYFEIFSRDTSEDELAALFGRLFAAVSAFNLLINLFVFNRLVLAFGVRHVAMIQPAAYLAAFALLLLHGGPVAAVFGFFAVHGIFTSIDSNNQNFLFNALPGAAKKATRTLLEGLAEPLATALAGAFLLAVALRFGPPQVSALGFALAGIHLLVVLTLCAEYPRSMASNLKQEWLDLSRPVGEVLGNLDSRALRIVAARARDADPEAARCAIRILWLNDRALAEQATLEYLERSDPALLSVDRSHVGEVLEGADPVRLRRLVLWAWCEAMAPGAPCLDLLARHGLLPAQLATHLLRSERPDQVAAGVVALWRSWRPEDRSSASATLHRLLAGPEEAWIVAGVEALSGLGESTMARHAASLLSHPSPKVKRQALLALRQIASPESSALVPSILRAIREGADADRYAGFQALIGIGDPTCVPPLLAMSAHFSPPLRRGVFRVLQGLGLKGVPGTVAALRDPGCQYLGRAIAARSLASIAFPQLESLAPALIDQEIARAERFHHHHRLAAARGRGSNGLVVLGRFYRDMRHRIVDFILELLTLDGRLPDFELLSASLRSGATKERANALETIEHSVERAVFKRLGPLLSPAIEVPSKAPLPGLDALLLHALDSPFELEASAAAQALLDARGAEALPHLRDRLLRPHASSLRDTVLARCGGGIDARTHVDRMAHLAAAPFFGTLPVWDLIGLASAGEYWSVPAGTALFRPGDMPERVLVMVSGGVLSGTGQRLGVGSLVGAEALRAAACGDWAVSEGAELLAVPVSAISDAVKDSAKVGMELLRFRLEDEGVTG